MLEEQAPALFDEFCHSLFSAALNGVLGLRSCHSPVTSCIADQYAQYVIVDDIKINSRLTLGEDVADLGGLILAWMAWREATAAVKLQTKDGLTPEQRFFVGFAQWVCENTRDEDKRVRALTNPHSPGIYRINGVVANMPEFAQAFACKPGAPLVRPKACKVW